ncbi:MAG: short-chain dehydrogenase [Solirubrobacterales bacterium 70-9]|nr:MAG: short-chain dehydrogenase [Solirubrobacterales bacterium 70-9]
MPGRVEGKVALVTGGGSGIGRAISIALAAEGATVVTTDIDGTAATATAALIEASGGTATAIAQDVTSEPGWEDAVETALSAHGKLDVLVNNAGIYIISALSETTLDDWNRLMAVNVTGVFLGMKHGSAPMVAAGGGSIINMSSIAARMGAPDHTLYGASKGAVCVMTKDVALELAAAKVRVNSIHPSFVNTAMARYGAAAAGASVEELGAVYPLGRIGEPEDVAAAALFLASDESSYITGSELIVDGGVDAGFASLT